jgi:hypothetical protein
MRALEVIEQIKALPASGQATVLDFVHQWERDASARSSPRLITEHSRVRLLAPLPAENLRAGEIGTVVHIYAGHEAYEVEFITQDARSVVSTLDARQIEPVAAA